MTNQQRIKLERSIVRKLIRELKKVGYTPIKVWDGGEYVDTPTEGEALDAVFAVDESTLHFQPPRGDWGRTGVFLVCGNGIDIISDYHCKDEIFSNTVDAVCSSLFEVEGLV